jgi:hypothetical protein
MSNFSSYLTDIMKRASDIAQQRSANIEKYSATKRASAISESNYSGGYKQTTTQPKQKFTSREVAQLRSLQQQAKSIEPTITDKLVTSISDISSAGKTYQENMIQKSKFGIEQASLVDSLLSKGGLLSKAGQAGLAQTVQTYDNLQRKLVTKPIAITEDQFNKLVTNPTVYNRQTRKNESVFTNQELSLLKQINSSDVRNDFFTTVNPNRRGQSSYTGITQAQMLNNGMASILSSLNKNYNNTLTDLNFIKTNQQGTNISYQIDPVKVEQERYKVNFLEGLKVKENDVESSFLTKLNDLKTKEETLLQSNLKNPYLSIIDLSGYKALIADAKAQETSMFKNLDEYTNTAGLSSGYGGQPQTVNFNNIKSGYVDTAKKTGQLVYNSYSSAYNELEKAIQSAKINWDTMNKTKASTLSGLDSILSTIKSKTSVSGAQHSLSDLDAQQIRRDLLNKQLDRTTSFSGTSTPRATFISRPA